MNDKRFYWIKLKTDFFNQKEIDFMLSQTNGCQYIVLYQMLCLNTANSNGEMATRINEMLVPYDIQKIVRDTKYFDEDTVIVALELFKKLGLIYEEGSGILKISNHDEMIGSEAGSANAQRQKRFRERQKQLKLTVTNSNANSNTKNNEDIEYRDKSIEIDKDIENNIYNYIEENFGRTLSPIEYEEVSKWENNELTRHAIKIAVLNNAYSFKYINSILENYKNKNIRTVQEAQQDEQNFKNKKKKNSLERFNEEIDNL